VIVLVVGGVLVIVIVVVVVLVASVCSVPSSARTRSTPKAAARPTRPTARTRRVTVVVRELTSRLPVDDCRPVGSTEVQRGLAERQDELLGQLLPVQPDGPDGDQLIGVVL